MNTTHTFKERNYGMDLSRTVDGDRTYIQIYTDNYEGQYLILTDKEFIALFNLMKQLMVQLMEQYFNETTESKED